MSYNNQKTIIATFIKRLTFLNSIDKKRLLKKLKKQVETLNEGTRQICPDCGSTKRKIHQPLSG